ncbi:MAG: ABC transporter substrate-binding protein [Bacteroidota bacterium]
MKASAQRGPLRKYVFFLFVLFLYACGEVQTEQKGEDINTDSATTDTLDIRHAKNFSILRHPDYVEVQVFNPYPNSEDTLRYRLFGSLESPRKGAFVVPIQKAVVFSAPHFGLIEKLEMTSSVTAISNQSYFATETEFTQIGELAQSSREVLFSLKPDVVFLTAISEDAYQKWSADGSISLPMVHCSEWLEQTPLGRAEWIKVFGAFYGKLDEAERLFLEMEKRYLETQTEVANESPKTCFTGSPFKGVWYMARGDSYIVNLLNDAGGQHLWAEGTLDRPI